MLSKVVEKGQKVKEAVSVHCKTHNQINKVFLLGALSFKKVIYGLLVLWKGRISKTAFGKKKGAAIPRKSIQFIKTEMILKYVIVFFFFTHLSMQKNTEIVDIITMSFD